MKTVRSLPPELQDMINKYNDLLDSYGYNQRWYNHDELTEMEDFTRLQKDGGIYQDTGLTADELKRRGAEVRGLAHEVVKLAEDLRRQGKITFSDEATANLNHILDEYGGSDTFFYAQAAEGEDGTAPRFAFFSPALPQFLPSDQIKPMRPIKVGQQEMPDRKLKQSTPIDIPELEKELMMRANPRMRTGQEPSYYIIKEGNRRVVRPVEEEELQYYRSKNRI
jgi:hypothetical protein